MEKNVNKIPARVRPGRGHRVAGLSSRNRAERGVEGCVARRSPRGHTSRCTGGPRRSRIS